jgi:hypothetical protein
MPKYKEVIKTSGISQQELTNRIHEQDARVDKSLMSKFVNYVCVPTPAQVRAINNILNCETEQLYTPEELQYGIGGGCSQSTARRRRSNVYNLTVEVDRELAERVFSPEAMRLLNISSKSDYIRQCLLRLDRRLAKKKEKR